MGALKRINGIIIEKNKYIRTAIEDILTNCEEIKINIMLLV